MSELKIFGFRFENGPSGSKAHAENDSEPWDLPTFKHYLSREHNPNENHIYIVQLPTFVHIQDSRLQPNLDATRELSTVLKEEFGMPRRILKEHMERGTLFRFSEIFANPKLPSEQEPNGTFTLPYYELQTFGGHWDREVFMDPKTEDFALSCGATGRQIQVHEWHEEQMQGPLLIIPRKCTLWSSGNGSGWNTIIVCDPPLRSTYAGGKEASPIPLAPTSPYAKGYKDFIPRQSQLRPKIPPPRDSLFHDLVHYFTSYSHLLNDPNESLVASFFPKKIIAAHYCTVLGFLQHQVVSMQARDWSIARRTQAGIDECSTIETAWLKFRCSPIRFDLDRVLDALAVPKADPDVRCIGDWRAWACDFRFLRAELVKCSRSYEALTSAMSALSGIILSQEAVEEARLSKEEAQRALREQKSTKTLTVLAVILAPMAVTSSLFSMGDFSPGEKRFKEYFMWALPFTMIVFLIAMVADWGYDAQAHWSFATLGKGAQRVLMGVSGGSRLGDDRENHPSSLSVSKGSCASTSAGFELQSIAETDITDLERTPE